jgi:hypothetical protein
MTPLLADAGIPMIVLQLPAMIVLLVPVVLIESLVAYRHLRIGFTKTASGLLVANLASTAMGFPLAWLIMLAVEFASYLLLLGMAHISPAIDRAFIHGTVSPMVQLALSPVFAAWVGGDTVWQVLIAATVLLIPTFYISVWIERRVCRRIWASYSLDRSSVNKVVRNANVVSYLFLFGAFTCVAVYAFTTGVVK